MRSGRLRHVLTIERLVSATTDLDSRGQPNQTWGQLAVVRGDLNPLSTREASQVRQQWAAASHEVRCRYVPNVTPACRITALGRTFAINEVQNLGERNRELRIVATEERH